MSLRRADLVQLVHCEASALPMLAPHWVRVLDESGREVARLRPSANPSLVRALRAEGFRLVEEG